MFKNNSVKIKITEQRLREYVLIFSSSFSFGETAWFASTRDIETFNKKPKKKPTGGQVGGPQLFFCHKYHVRYI